MILREEVFEQLNGLGVLELRGRWLERVLFLDGKPLIYDANDCSGSVGRFTLFLPFKHSFAARLDIERGAEQGFGDAFALHQSIGPLLRLLPSGIYRLSLEEVPHHMDLIWETQGGLSQQFQPYYPYGDKYESLEVFVPTQPEEALYEKRVQFYVEVIEKGTRPALIVLSVEDSSALFVLDGHHKLAAYRRCGIAPHVLRIEVQQREPISWFFARQMLDEIDPMWVSHYLDFKKRVEE